MPHLSRQRLLAGAAFFTLTCSGLSADPLRVLPIGDSITQGGRADRAEYTYRLPLQEMLKNSGIAFDFIGTRTKGLQEAANWPEVAGAPFDPDHEGFYGAKTAYVRDRIREDLPKLTAPDVALIHLGTNDQNSPDFSEAIVKPLEEMIAILREKNPRVIVLVGHLAFNGGSAPKIRPLVEEMARRLSTETSPVVTVAHFDGWKENPADKETDTFDWAHPNPKGQKRMAENWMNALKPLLAKRKN